MTLSDKKGNKKGLRDKIKPKEDCANENIKFVDKENSKSKNKKWFNKNEKMNSYYERTLTFLKRIFSRQFIYELVFNPFYFPVAACAFLVLEAVLNIFIIENIKYTEIDWVAYMQEVEGFLNGTRDYTKLRGDTGPLVYPAGFLYIFSILYKVTERGTNIYLAQYIFAGIYLLTLALVFRIYNKSKKVPPYILVFICCFSYRIHSIYVLRLFNDPIAVFLFYCALNCFISDWWTIGSVFYSLAVGVKMNILLYAPALLMSYLYCLGPFGTFFQLLLCFVIQVLLGLPFLLENPVGYVMQAFNLGRVFLYEWTVNWRFLPEHVFVHPWFHVFLLGAHVAVLCILVFTHWHRYLLHYGSLHQSKLDVACQLLLLPLFMSNFVGIAFCRSLHYQFYVWYFHTLPYLLWSTRISISLRLLLLGLVELCWNTFPSTVLSSALLHLCHGVILISLIANRPTKERVQSLKKRLLKSE